MFYPDHSPDLPTACDLLAVLGIDPMTVREVIDHDRAIRCPEHAPVFPAYGFMSLAPEHSGDPGLQDAGPPDRCPGQADEPRDPAPAHLPAG